MATGFDKKKGDVRAIMQKNIDDLEITIMGSNFQQVVYRKTIAHKNIIQFNDIFDSEIKKWCEDAIAIASELEREKKFLEAAKIGDRVFESFTPVTTSFIFNMQHIFALQLWITIIKHSSEWANKINGHIHRGTAYYFAAYAAWKSRNHDLAFRLLHSALEDDKRLNSKTGKSSMDFPAYYTVSLQDNPNNYLHMEVLHLRSVLEKKIESYNTRTKSSLSLEDFEKLFLQNADFEKEVFLFTYVLAWLDHWDSLSSIIDEEDLFSRSRRLQIYLTMGVILERILRIRLINDKMLGKNILYVAEKRLGITNFKDLAYRNNKRKEWMTDFDKTFNKMLVKHMGSKELSFGIMWAIRNEAAHPSNLPKVLTTQSDQITESAFDAIFYSVQL